MGFFNNFLKGKKGEPKRPMQGTAKAKEEDAPKGVEQEIRLPGKYSGGVLVSPQITEKSSLAGALNKYVFRVTKKSTKNEVKKAIEKKYGVHVAGVNVMNMPSKKVRLGRTIGHVPGYKKATVTLEKGERIEIGL